MQHHHDQSRVRLNYKKAKSLLEKIDRMLADDAYCVDVMHQNLAVMGLLRSAHQMLMEKHLSSCFRTAMEGGSEKKKQAMIEEMIKVANFSQK